MGEIRSTLDIIMEKAKKFTLTEEEKSKFHRQEVVGKVSGLVQKFLDGLIKPHRLKEELAALEKQLGEMVREALIDKAKEKMDPLEDNTPLLEMLELVAGVDTAHFRKILKECSSEFKLEREERQAQFRKYLETKGVSGSAVIPNIEADQEWASFMSDMRHRFKDGISDINCEVKAYVTV